MFKVIVSVILSLLCLILLWLSIKKQRMPSVSMPEDLFVNETKRKSVVVKSLTTTSGSAIVKCDSKGVKIKLSRGGKFSGIINDKKIELEGPEDKDWEEFYIKT